MKTSINHFEGKKKRTIHDLHLKDDYLFAKVMGDEEICKEFLEKLLGFKIASIEIAESQKSIDLSYASRGSRLDIFVRDDRKQAYCIEKMA